MQIQLIGQTFYEFRSRAFYLNEELVSEFLLLFFRIFDDQWIALSVDDGVAMFVVEESEPTQFQFNDSESNDTFIYPINNLSELDCYIGSSIIALQEYRLKAAPDDCVGIYFDCGDKGFSIFRDEDNLVVFSNNQDIPFIESLVLSPIITNRMTDIR